MNKPIKVDYLLTNFHLPKSTLIMLVASFIGLEKTLELYNIAIKENYRFYSYGDGMLINLHKSL
jgi:S-adenosylmethionine:tRNA ribosyltransferase-isomerase